MTIAAVEARCLHELPASRAADPAWPLIVDAAIACARDLVLLPASVPVRWVFAPAGYPNRAETDCAARPPVVSFRNDWPWEMKSLAYAAFHELQHVADAHLQGLASDAAEWRAEAFADRALTYWYRSGHAARLIYAAGVMPPKERRP